MQRQRASVSLKASEFGGCQLLFCFSCHIKPFLTAKFLVVTAKKFTRVTLFYSIRIILMERMHICDLICTSVTSHRLWDVQKIGVVTITKKEVRITCRALGNSTLKLLAEVHYSAALLKLSAMTFLKVLTWHGVDCLAYTAVAFLNASRPFGDFRGKLHVWSSYTQPIIIHGNVLYNVRHLRYSSFSLSLSLWVPCSRLVLWAVPMSDVPVKMDYIPVTYARPLHCTVPCIWRIKVLIKIPALYIWRVNAVLVAVRTTALFGSAFGVNTSHFTAEVSST